MFQRKRLRLMIGAKPLVLGERTLVMGVLNVTPDSFSDGGLHLNRAKAIARALEMENEGADIIDIGGESTRPGAAPISDEEELARVMPVIEGLRKRLKAPISIDTRRAAVAEAAVRAGAKIINDVTALRFDPLVADVARRHRTPLILMHMRGEPATMQRLPFARNALADVSSGLRAAAARALRAGIGKRRIILDPGIGFGKSYAQNFELLARLPELARIGYPLLIGPSRKSFLGHAQGGPPAQERIWGTAATVTAGILGGAHIVRVHDVEEMVAVACVADLLLRGRQGARPATTGGREPDA
jgi:dihydropteroate synthase